MHPLEVEVARRLRDMVPCAEMTRFFKTGAEACNAAVRVARAYTGKEVVLSSGYHGWLDWASAAREGERGIPVCLRASIESFAFNDCESLVKAREKHAGRVACVFCEPASAHFEPEGQFVDLLFRVAREEEALVVFDEIVTGFRLAPGGAQERYGAVPDLATFAKAMSNGLPLAALCGKREYMELAGDLLISSTYAGETLSLAAAVATLDKLRREHLTDHFWRLGEMLSRGMKEVADAAGIPLDTCGPHPIGGFRFTPADEALVPPMMHYLLQETAKRGVLLRRGGCNFIFAAHTEADIRTALEALEATFKGLAACMSDSRLREHVVVSEELAGGPGFKRW